MKVRLEKGGSTLVINRLGRVVFVIHPTEPETETGYFDDDTAQAGLEALRDRFLAQGWVEVKPPPPPVLAAPEPWTPDAEAVLARLGPVMSPVARALLEPLLRVGVLTSEGGDLSCALGADTLRFTGGGSDPRTPPALAAFLDECGGLVMGEVGDFDQLVLHDGFSGTLHTVGNDAWPDDACSPIDLHLRSFYVFDPRTGQLFYESRKHRVQTNDAVEVYLREVHLRLKGSEPPAALAQLLSPSEHRYTWMKADEEPE